MLSSIVAHQRVSPDKIWGNPIFHFCLRILNINFFTVRSSKLNLVPRAFLHRGKGGRDVLTLASANHVIFNPEKLGEINLHIIMPNEPDWARTDCAFLLPHCGVYFAEDPGLNCMYYDKLKWYMLFLTKLFSGLPPNLCSLRYSMHMSWTLCYIINILITITVIYIITIIIIILLLSLLLLLLLPGSYYFQVRHSLWKPLNFSLHEYCTF